MNCTKTLERQTACYNGTVRVIFKDFGYMKVSNYHVKKLDDMYYLVKNPNERSRSVSRRDCFEDFNSKRRAYILNPGRYYGEIIRGRYIVALLNSSFHGYVQNHDEQYGKTE